MRRTRCRTATPTRRPPARAPRRDCESPRAWVCGLWMGWAGVPGTPPLVYIYKAIPFTRMAHRSDAVKVLGVIVPG